MNAETPDAALIAGVESIADGLDHLTYPGKKGAEMLRKLRDRLAALTAPVDDAEVAKWTKALRSWDDHELEEVASLVERCHHQLQQANRNVYDQMLDWRDIDGPEDACSGCGGSGRKAYGDTSTWGGGIGGQTVTGSVCDECWGTGSQSRKGPDLRRVVEMERKLQQAEAERDLAKSFHDVAVQQRDTYLRESQRWSNADQDVLETEDHEGYKTERDELRGQEARWVPVTERLPERDHPDTVDRENGDFSFSYRELFVLDKYGYMSQQRCMWQDFSPCGFAHNITHWLDNVPPPPQEDTDAEA